MAIEYKTTLSAISCILLVIGSASSKTDGWPQEVCENEMFYAECPPGEVILMKTAMYGRMNLGRCLKSDLGWVGCYGHVILIADRKCSGRRYCSIGIPNPEFDAVETTCLEESRPFYLEASYECVKVVEKPDEKCQESGINLIELQGYLSNLVVEEASKGDFDCPWVLDVPAGMYADITFYDFSLSETAGKEIVTADRPEDCKFMAVLFDLTSWTEKYVCSGVSRDGKIPFPKSDRIMVQLFEPAMTGVIYNLTGPVYNMIKYEYIPE